MQTPTFSGGGFLPTLNPVVSCHGWIRAARPMNSLRHAGLLALITALAWGPAFARDRPPTRQSRPDALIASLYRQVVARHPLGIPYGKYGRIFVPYLSKALLQRFDLNIACFHDWARQHPDPNEKPSIGMFEDGVFSGDSEKAEPKAFHIERTELQKDGSSRVYVRLVWSDPYNKPMTWRVAAVVVPEDGRLVVDDVLYLKDGSDDVEGRLSEGMAYGCDGGKAL